MVIFLLFIGVVLIVAAVRNSHEALFNALGQDVPSFVVWAAAIVAIGAIGFIPDLKPVSRGLLALVIIVIVLQNYSQVLAGFQSAWKNPPAAGVAGASAVTTSSGTGSAATSAATALQGGPSSSDVPDLVSMFSAAGF